MVDTTGPRDRGRLLAAPRRGVLLAAVLLVGAAVVGAVLWQQRGNEPASVAESPSPSRPATAVQPEAGLRLLLADTPAPLVIDVNEGTTARVSGLPTRGDRSVGVAAAGRDALLLAYRFCPRCRAIGVYVLRHGATSATRLATALQAVSSQDGRGAWLLQRRRGGPDRCLLAEIDLAGRARGTPILVGCRLGLVADLPAGLFVSSAGALGRNAHSAIIERDAAMRRYADPYARPVLGNLVLSGSGPGTPLVLHDMGTGANRRLRWPSRRGFGLGEVSGSPDGRHAVVGFARYSPHRLDLWLLDTRTGSWRHLPGMPAQLVSKATDVEWTPDGRVVVLSEGTARVWRPGETTMETRRIPSGRRSGSQFVVW
jgi:hypothetical protein